MKVLVACEYSGTVRDAFLRAGHYAMSCDILPSESDLGEHYQGDVFDVIDKGWDLMVAHPPCTYLTNAANGSLEKTEPSKSGALTGPSRWKALIDGAVFFRELLNAPVPMVAVENPRMNPYARKVIGSESTQSVQPWQFGEMQSKETHLWLRNLPPLTPTLDVRAEMLKLPKREWAKVHNASPGPERSKIRSLFFPGVADAMAAQWGGLMSDTNDRRATA